VKILNSPRRRRRLIKIAVVLAIFPLAYLGIHYSTGGSTESANGPEVPNYVQPKHSPFTEAERRAVHPVLAQFIRYAVAREDPAKAWDVAGPDLRSGLTRKKWDTGAIPVVNYPAAHKGLGSWSYVKYSYANTVGLEVFVFPKPGSGYSAMTADAEVVKDRRPLAGQLLDAGALPRARRGCGDEGEGGQEDRARRHEEIDYEEDRRSGASSERPACADNRSLACAADRDPLADHPGAAGAPARRVAPQPSSRVPRRVRRLSARTAAPSA
jgi:hypothetical protein